jgi:uncharacterized protein YndB with AHSA1/START domain
MSHEFEVREEIALEATPEQVWEAIATGPGIDSWFMGRNQIEPRQGGTGRMSMGDFTQESTVTAWEPGKRLAYQSKENPDGTFMAFEYLIEGRDGGSTVLRLVHSGILGDDWEAEYDALNKGDAMYLRKLATYLEHFPGRTATCNISAWGPQVAGSERVWAAFQRALALTGTVTEGDQARLTVDGLAPVEAVVDYVAHPSFLGVRTRDGLYRFIHGHQDTVVVEQHSFSDGVDPEQTEQAWQTWLSQTFA